VDEYITMITQQLKHLNQKTNISKEKKTGCLRKEDQQKLFKEIQVNDQICTNLNFRKKKKTVIYLYAHYGFKYLKTVRY
jgi:hypothetical protein